MTAKEFNPKEMEEKWIKEWSESKIFQPKPEDRKKFYLTVAYPYPSGSMHVGHGRTYTVPDVIARFKRMQGYNVLFPMAWHVTGSPVLGIAERIKRKDPKTMHIYGELYKVPPETMVVFTEPKNIVKHFSEEYRRDMTNLGFSIDWTREFLTITPQYSRFVIWQYMNLHRQGLVKKGEHPVRYCPRCDNPVGDHDLLEGEAATINEFTIIKFKLDDLILPAATLRPETIFGVTNMWLNPEVEYLRAKVDGEPWLLSKEAAEKLNYAGRNVEVVGKAMGKELIGKSCRNPIDGKDVPIMAASFVDPNYATGVVMSVPAHAPYDYIALKDLGGKMAPITIIETEKGKDVPAKDIVEALGITDQKDKKLEEATEVLYRAEHAKGVMKKEIAVYGGLFVRDAREKVAADLTKKGEAAIFYELSQSPVVCRCGTRCFIKLLKDQWFLEYSNLRWKEKAHKCLDAMAIVPPETRQNFDYFIDWLKDWACTRKVGLGTRLPWDQNWLIEPLSDSTIYMAYYTISRHLKELDAEKLGEEFFDFVFLGKGDISDVAREAGTTIEKVKEIRKEFTYWYPPQWRFSAKDLVGNHLTFHMFHHTALFPENCWPKGIVVFGMGLLEGNKMSSSKGNIILLSEAIKTYGSDTVRLFLMSTAEPWQDFDWRETLVKNTQKKLKQFYDQVSSITAMDNDLPERDIDCWLTSRVEESIKETTIALEGFQTRKALQSAFFNILNDLTWYMRRCEPNAKTLKEAADKWVRLMAPFTPFTCEELWCQMPGKKSFISVADYPEPAQDKINAVVLQKEDMIKGLIQDIQNILEVTGAKPVNVHVYLAPEWKRKVFASIKAGKTISDIMKDAEMKKNGQLIVSLMKKVRKEEIPENILTSDEEYETLSEATDFLGREFKSKLLVHKTPDYDPENKEKNALPMRPGIYLQN
jgi:leucyl-tRNA synthetase